MFNPFLMLLTFIGVGARINEYIPSPSVDIESHQITHTSGIKLPQSFTWSNVDGVNYLTKNVNYLTRKLLDALYWYDMAARSSK